MPQINLSAEMIDTLLDACRIAQTDYNRSARELERHRTHPGRTAAQAERDEQTVATVRAKAIEIGAAHAMLFELKEAN